jgi:uncharacterized protein (TIGR03066 family)
MIASSIFCVGMSMIAAPVAADDKPFKIDPNMLVGVWEVEKASAPPVGSTLTFTGQGKFEASIKGENIRSTGTYTVKDDRVTFEPPGDSITVLDLTKVKMVVVGRDGEGDDIIYKRKGAVPAAGPRPARKSGGVTVGVAKAATGGKWAVVKSPKDGFTVEMPGQPTGEANQSGGGFEVHTLSFRAVDLEFIAVAVHGPTEVPEAERPKVLQSVRDKAMRNYGRGIVVASEKPVKLGAIDGLEFDVSFDRTGVGQVDVQGRTFLKGKMAYAVLVIPQVKDAKPPISARKFLDSFSLGGGGEAPTAAAKPHVRKSPAGRDYVKKGVVAPTRAWGTEVDPDGDVEIETSGASVTMGIPGTPHLLAPERGTMNAPRIIAPTRGDFGVSVRVDGAFRPGRQSTVTGLSSRQAGGLVLWKDAQNYLVFQHRASFDDGMVVHQTVLEEIVGGAKGASHRHAFAEGATYLRLERKRGRISAAYSADGKKWKELKSVETTWADGEIQAGVVAVNTSTEPHAVTFSEYSLEAQ